MDTTKRDYNYFKANRGKYQKLGAPGEYDKFLADLLAHEQQSVVKPTGDKDGKKAN